MSEPLALYFQDFLPLASDIKDSACPPLLEIVFDHAPGHTLPELRQTDPFHGSNDLPVTSFHSFRSSLVPPSSSAPPAVPYRTRSPSCPNGRAAFMRSATASRDLSISFASPIASPAGKKRWSQEPTMSSTLLPFPQRNASPTAVPKEMSQQLPLEAVAPGEDPPLSPARVPLWNMLEEDWLLSGPSTSPSSCGSISLIDEFRMTPPTHTPPRAARLVQDFSLQMSPEDIPKGSGHSLDTIRSHQSQRWDAISSNSGHNASSTSLCFSSFSTLDTQISFPTRKTSPVFRKEMLVQISTWQPPVPPLFQSKTRSKE